MSTPEGLDDSVATPGRLSRRSQVGLEPPATRGETEAPANVAIVEPLRGQASRRELRRLELALAMIMGIESYVALSDIYGVKPREAKEVWRWACKALIRAVAAEGDGRSGS